MIVKKDLEGRWNFRKSSTLVFILTMLFNKNSTKGQQKGGRHWVVDLTPFNYCIVLKCMFCQRVCVCLLVLLTPRFFFHCVHVWTDMHIPMVFVFPVLLYLLYVMLFQKDMINFCLKTTQIEFCGFHICSFIFILS